MAIFNSYVKLPEGKYQFCHGYLEGLELDDSMTTSCGPKTTTRFVDGTVFEYDVQGRQRGAQEI
jgi:phage baseplate assembly protein gpV